MRKLIVLFAMLTVLVCAGCAGEKLTFEEKLKLPGGTSGTSCVNNDLTIKTFGDYEQKEIIPRYRDPAIVKVKCNKVNHYVYIHQGLIDCDTINTVTITKIYKVYGADVYQENQEINLIQKYGYLPICNDEDMDRFFRKEYGIRIEEACANDESRYLVDLSKKYNYHMFSTFEDTVPLDEDEEYLMVLESSISAEENSRNYYIAMVVPYNTEKYKRVFNNECGFEYTEYGTNLRNELRKTFME
ncbi:MAG: hypothetical protein ACLSVG_10480 [Clostridia bacterium]